MSKARKEAATLLTMEDKAKAIKRVERERAARKAGAKQSKGVATNRVLSEIFDRAGMSHDERSMVAGTGGPGPKPILAAVRSGKITAKEAKRLFKTKVFGPGGYEGAGQADNAEYELHKGKHGKDTRPSLPPKFRVR